jgi:putative oxidoreductase
VSFIEAHAALSLVSPITGDITLNISSALSNWQSSALGILRIYTGLSILQHGTAKILAFPHVAAIGKPPVGSLGWTAGIIELVGGILIIFGLFTRPAAFLMAGFTAVAYWMVHAPKGFYPILNGGELAAVYCFVFLYLVFAGAGRFSIDGLLKK